MGRVSESLAPGVEHVVFGHTHRAGPLPDDDRAEWTTLSGIRLWNSGNWFHEPAFVGRSDDAEPVLARHSARASTKRALRDVENVLRDG